jgi:hypothetical protein
VSKKLVLWVLSAFVLPVAASAADFQIGIGEDGVVSFGNRQPVQSSVIEPELQAKLDTAGDNEMFRIIIRGTGR